MKRLSGVIVVVCLVGLMLAACSRSAGVVGPSVTVNGPTIVVGTNSTYPPFEQVNTANKSVVGFDIDLMRTVAARAGYNVQFNTSLSYNKMLGAVGACTYDAAISAILVTDDLKQKMSFTDPYYTFGEVVAVKSGNTAITGQDKLAGMTVGVQSNTTSQTAVAEIQGAKMKVYATFDLAFNDLLAGSIDAVVTDKITALAYVNLNPNSLKIVGTEFAMESYTIAVCSTKPDVLKKLNDALASVKSDGTIGTISDTWLSKPVIK